jgi:hypothetical protein
MRAKELPDMSHPYIIAGKGAERLYWGLLFVFGAIVLVVLSSCAGQGGVGVRALGG